MNRNTLRTALVLAAAAAVAAGPAHAAAQKTYSKCSVSGPGGANVVYITVQNGFTPFGDVGIKLNNATGADKKATVWFSADAGVDAGSEMRFAMQIDGAAGQFAGPQNFANHTEFWQTRSAIATVTVPPGVHTLTPGVFVQGNATQSGQIDDRCMVVTF